MTVNSIEMGSMVWFITASICNGIGLLSPFLFAARKIIICSSCQRQETRSFHAFTIVRNPMKLKPCWIQPPPYLRCSILVTPLESQVNLPLVHTSCPTPWCSKISRKTLMIFTQKFVVSWKNPFEFKMILIGWIYSNQSCDVSPTRVLMIFEVGDPVRLIAKKP